MIHDIMSTNRRQIIADQSDRQFFVCRFSNSIWI